MGLGMMLVNWSCMMASMVAFCSLLHFVMLKYLFNKYSLFFSNFIFNFYHKKALNRMVENWFHYMEETRFLKVIQ